MEFMKNYYEILRSIVNNNWTEMNDGKRSFIKISISLSVVNIFGKLMYKILPSTRLNDLFSG